MGTIKHYALLYWLISLFFNFSYKIFICSFQLLGLWDVHREDSSNGAHFFNPHSRPINCLTVDPWNYQNVYTTSYDGSVRRTDLTSGIVQQVKSIISLPYSWIQCFQRHLNTPSCNHYLICLTKVWYSLILSFVLDR